MSSENEEILTDRVLRGVEDLLKAKDSTGFTELIAEQLVKDLLSLMGIRGFPREHGFELWEGSILDLSVSTLRSMDALSDWNEEEIRPLLRDALKTVLGRDPAVVPQHIVLLRHLVARWQEEESDTWIEVDKRWQTPVSKLLRAGLIQAGSGSGQYLSVRLVKPIAVQLAGLVDSWNQREVSSSAMKLPPAPSRERIDD